MICVDDDDRNDSSTVAPMTINYCQIGCDSEKTDSITKSLGGWLDFGENDNPSAATRGWTNTIQIPDKYWTNTIDDDGERIYWVTKGWIWLGVI